MAYNAYFGSKPVSDWTANGPAESGHNFIDQINEQGQKVSGAEDRYGQAYGNISGAQNAYDQAYQNQQGYGDLYGQAKGTEGVDDAQAQYQKSLASANATQAAMNNLPSSINARSNVVLNQSQRNAALGNQMTKYQNTLDYWTRQNQADLGAYQTALASAQDLAKTSMGQEQARVSQAMANLQTQMDQANALYDQVLQERAIMRQIYGDMYEDEYRHMQQEIEAWAANLQAETQRYAEDQATARNNAKIAADKEAADISKYLGSGYTWDGNQWVSPYQEPKPLNYIDTYGNAYTPQTGAVSVEPIVRYGDNGQNAYTRQEYYIPDANMLAQLMYGAQ
jgi:glutaredoxin 2